MRIIECNSYRDGGTQVFACDNGKSYVINHAIGDEPNHGKLTISDGEEQTEGTIDDVNNLVFAIENMTLIGSEDYVNHYIFYSRISAIKLLSEYYGVELHHVQSRLERQNGYFITCDNCNDILYVDSVEQIPLDTEFSVKCEGCGHVRGYKRSSRSTINGNPTIRKFHIKENQ